MNNSFDEIEQKLLNYPRFRKEPGFETVKALLNVIAYEDNIPLIHVAGTNGKGTVIAMLSSILRKKNLNVGVFTSPHLIDIRERMTLNGQMMEKHRFVEIYELLTSYVQIIMDKGYHRPTFFEWLFLMMVIHFKETKPDVILLESGLGGRLDTTNVLEHKILTIITSISLDHTEILGNSIKEIAYEKAGIVRKGIPLVLFNEKNDVTEVIEGICNDKEIKLVKVLPFEDEILKRKEESIDFSIGNKYYKYESFCSNTGEDYRVDNAKVAFKAARTLGDIIKIDSEDIINGLAEYQWPGRMDYIAPNIIVDGAHNEDGMASFVRYMNHNEQDKAIDLLFACMPNKDANAMIQEIVKISSLSKVYIPMTSFLDEARALKLSEQFRDNGQYEVLIVKNLKDFIEQRLEACETEVVMGCVGSLYLVGTVIALERSYRSKKQGLR